MKSGEKWDLGKGTHCGFKHGKTRGGGCPFDLFQRIEMKQSVDLMTILADFVKVVGSSWQGTGHTNGHLDLTLLCRLTPGGQQRSV